MDQELIKSFKAKYIAGDGNDATEEELANWYEYLKAEGVDNAIKFLGNPKVKKAKK